MDRDDVRGRKAIGPALRGAIRMSIFNLHATILDDYRDFVRSFFTVADHRARLPYRRDEARRALLRAELDAW